MFALMINAADQIGKRRPAGRGDILQRTPERFLKADTVLCPERTIERFKMGDFTSSIL